MTRWPDGQVAAIPQVDARTMATCQMSLLVLDRCINSLIEGTKYIPTGSCYTCAWSDMPHNKSQLLFAA